MATPEPAPAPRKFDLARAKETAYAALRLIRKMGAGAADLLRRLKKDTSPQAMLTTLEQAAEANRVRREEISARTEKLYMQLVERKKAYQSAPPARKRILEAELSALLAQHKAAERELTALLENERVLAQTIGRIHELAAMGMAGVTELQMDDLIEEVEAAVADADARLDAARDLDRAGRRRERASEKESLWEQLAEFDNEPTAAPALEETSPGVANSPLSESSSQTTAPDSIPPANEDKV